MDRKSLMVRQLTKRALMAEAMEEPFTDSSTRGTFRRTESVSSSTKNARVSLLSHRAASARQKVDKLDDEMEQQLLVADVAEGISNEFKTISLIAALLSSWSCTVYAGENVPEEGLCLGEPMVKATKVLFWISLGWFFLCVSSTLVIIADLDGIPQHLLFEHLSQKSVRVIYLIPELSMIGGVLFLAAGYATDIGERAGCPYLIFAAIAAPGFVCFTALIFFVLKSNRSKLNTKLQIGNHNNPLGKHMIATWRDKLQAIENLSLNTELLIDDRLNPNDHSFKDDRPAERIWET